MCRPGNLAKGAKWHAPVFGGCGGAVGADLTAGKNGNRHGLRRFIGAWQAMPKPRQRQCQRKKRQHRKAQGRGAPMRHSGNSGAAVAGKATCTIAWLVRAPPVSAAAKFKSWRRGGTLPMIFLRSETGRSGFGISPQG